MFSLQKLVHRHHTGTRKKSSKKSTIDHIRRNIPREDDRFGANESVW
ncbi:hypothetical protein ANCCAN_10095 [Ancylostoma caninum]|uniref:Uncharacterized protein n=1 Tax=Ancylostoma caninum TaxID=29170 RepID=A0A368GHP1_ANCCA|nr:hypothetical protein ANCCAN_10095 [Ancylostoma caninum]